MEWQWQFRNALKTQADFERYFELTESERQGFARSADLFKIQTTPYYASLADRYNERDPIRRMILPLAAEVESGVQQMPDPLGENDHSPVERIIHRYPDRVLFLVTDLCGVYCRYCLRKHFTGHDAAFIKHGAYQWALEYLHQAKGVREVILSGGDPLTLNDTIIERVLSDIRAVPHIEIIRVGTRMPVVCPMRITENLAKVLRQSAPVFVMTHFNHPQELSAEAAKALGCLVDHGIPVFNQMVLLNGINNHPAIVYALSRRLLYLRTKPYYMFQCDPSVGTDHLRTNIESSLAIQRELWGRMSGLAMPNLSIDIPGGGGKVPMVPDFVRRRSEKQWEFTGWDGKAAEYKNPDGSNLVLPFDLDRYLPEWNEIVQQEYGSRSQKNFEKD